MASASHAGGQGTPAAPSPALTPIMLPLDPSVTPPPAAPRAIPPTPAPTPSSSPAAGLPDIVPAVQPAPVPVPAPAAPTPAVPVATLPPQPGSTEAAVALNLALAGRLPHPTQMHGSVIVANRLYVFGGETEPGGWSTLAQSAPILSDGKLGPWRKETDLPGRRGYITNSVRAVGNTVYIIGGLAPDSPTQEEELAPAAAEALWTTVQADGKLGPWKKSEEFLSDQGLYSVTATGTDKHLYAVGGTFHGEVSTAVYRCDLQADGTPDDWRQVATLPVPLWFHGAEVVGGRLFVWGGLKGASSVSVNPFVYSAELRPDGTLSSWDEETRMPNAIYSGAFAAAGDHLLAIAGRYQGGVFTSDLWSAPLVAGQLGHWKAFRTNLESRAYHSVGVDTARGTIYVTGGRFRSGEESRFIDAVQAFQVSGE